MPRSHREPWFAVYIYICIDCIDHNCHSDIFHRSLRDEIAVRCHACCRTSLYVGSGHWDTETGSERGVSSVMKCAMRCVMRCHACCRPILCVGAGRPDTESVMKCVVRCQMSCVLQTQSLSWSRPSRHRKCHEVLQTRSNVGAGHSDTESVTRCYRPSLCVEAGHPDTESVMRCVMMCLVCCRPSLCVGAGHPGTETGTESVGPRDREQAVAGDPRRLQQRICRSQKSR